MRGDAKLEQLDEAQQERLRFWLEENCTYSEIVRLVREEFGLSVGKSAVSVYYRRHILPEQQQDDAEIVAAFATLPTADFDTATLQRARALAFSALARPDPDIDTAVKLLAIVRKAEQHALALRRLELEERKVALRESQEARRAAEEEKRAMAARKPSPARLAAVASDSERMSEMQSPPRFPDWSDSDRPHGESQGKLDEPQLSSTLETEDQDVQGDAGNFAPISAGTAILPRASDREVASSVDSGAPEISGDGVLVPVVVPFPSLPSPSHTLPTAKAS